jgi:hypothetical protein
MISLIGLSVFFLNLLYFFIVKIILKKPACGGWQLQQATPNAPPAYDTAMGAGSQKPPAYNTATAGTRIGLAPVRYSW